MSSNNTSDGFSHRGQFESETDFCRIFEYNARRRANCVALNDPAEDRRLTYAELNAAAEDLARAFYADGVRAGGRVSVALFNSVEFVVAYVAAQKLGAVFAPLNFKWSAVEIANALDDTKPVALIYDAEIESVVAAAMERVEEVPARLSRVGDADAELLDATPYEEYSRSAAGLEGDFTSFSPERGGTTFTESTRIFTSGTTGRAKGVPMTRLNELDSARQVTARYPLCPEDVTMNATPWFHRGGLHGGMLPSLYVGAEIVVMRQFTATVCLKYLREHRVTVLLGVPSASIMLAKRQEKYPVDLSCLRLIVMMGSDLEKDVCRYLQQIFPGVDLINSYGTTESFLNTFLGPTDALEYAGTAGRAAYDDDVILVEPIEDGWGDPSKLVAKDGETPGELIVRVASKSPGQYFERPEESAKKFHNGWIYTGDIATWDEKEYITIVGRKDDMTVLAGENVYPQPIEEAICASPDVVDCIVTSVPDLARGRALVAYVIPARADLDRRELLKFCAESPSLSSFTIPRYFCFVSELPYSATGKKLRYVLKARAEAALAAGELTR
ncbi:MAG: acyl--CoA ligase [Thermoguttaceae bacterium]|nr:acyl--CoA ligase [Thermoguttaceae bacterium]